jgi:diguanylate cyclase (GGDEF)-like protein
MIEENSIKLLLVEDDIDYAYLLQNFLKTLGETPLTWSHAESLAAALEMVRDEQFDVILLDLLLPDRRGIETFDILREHAPEEAIVVLTAVNDEDLGVQAVREGAQDYLIKGSFDNAQLLRSLRYAIERHQARSALRRLALIDELTSLYNRRGFLSLARQHLKLAKRSNTDILLIMLDVDGLKRVNDTYGHLEGDRVLIRVGEVLKSTFRASDIIARLGGDEFTVLAIDATDQSADTITDRILKNLEAHHAANPGLEFSVSVGAARYSPGMEVSLEELIAQADEDLYAHKAKKSKTSTNE